MRPENHPDENILAAFADRSICAKQRLLVLSHLADCVSCRDVVEETVRISTVSDSSSRLASAKQRRFQPAYQVAAAIFFCLLAISARYYYLSVPDIEKTARPALALPGMLTEMQSTPASSAENLRRASSVRVRRHGKASRFVKRSEVLTAREPWRHWDFSLLPPVSARSIRGNTSAGSFLFAGLPSVTTDAARAKPRINQIALNTSAGEKWITVSPLWIAK